MSNLILDSFKNIMLAGIGAMALTAEKGKEIIDELVAKGEMTVEQGKVVNEELKRAVKERMDGTDEKKAPSVDEILSQLDTMDEDERQAIKAKLSDLDQS